MVWNETYSGEIKYMDLQRDAIRLRYNLLNYLYTEYARAVLDQSTFYSPVFFSHPDNEAAYANPGNDVMVGRALKHSPIYSTIDSGSEPFFFPAGKWCSVVNGKCLPQTTKDSTQNLSRKLSENHIHLKGGNAIPWNHLNETENELVNTKHLQSSFVGLMLLFNDAG
jgi:alpha-glucosidase (family GH31 glycosyl hydrolase)